MMVQEGLNQYFDEGMKLRNAPNARDLAIRGAALYQ